MVQKVIPVLLFAATAVAVIQLVNLSFTQTYRQVEASVQKPYAAAQNIYDAGVE